VVSGLAVLATPVRASGYFPLILGHQGLGLLALLVAGVGLLLPRAEGRAPRWPLAAAVAGGLLGGVALAGPGPVGWLAPWVLGLFSLGLVVTGLLDREAPRGTGRVRLAAALGATVAVVGGAWMDFVPVARLGPMQELHSHAGAAAVVLLLLVVAEPALRRLPRGVGLAVALVAGGALLAGAGLLRPGLRHLEPVRYSTLGPADGGEPARAPREQLDRSESCGAGGCHEAIWHQWAGSPHRFAAANRLYGAAVAELVAQERWDGVRFCANCHDPAAVLSGTLEEAYAGGGPGPSSEGVGCVVCHSIRKVHGRPPANGAMDIDLVPPEPGEGEQLAQRIRLDARRHRLAWSSNPGTSTSSICKVCHRVQVGREGELVLKYTDPPVAGEGRDDERCADCHLPRAGGDERSHAMAGIAFDLAAYARADSGDMARIEEHVELVREQVGALAWERIDGPSWSGPEAGLREPPAHLLDLSVEPSLDPETGAVVLAITTHSTARGHSFPSGPWDLQQVWLEVRVADAAGNVIHHEGGLDEDGRIVGDPLRLGAILVDAEGHAIERHEILRLYSIARERVLAAQGEPIEDVLRIESPEGSQPPYDVRLRWLFRRAGADFATWALQTDESPIPAWELVGTRLVVDYE